MNFEKEELRETYISRINRVQDYIEAHLEEAFSLESLAQIAHFSPCHFHRIFGSFVGETLFEYIQRLRIEKAAYLLIAQPKESITQISLTCGFANQASFAKAFKKYWEMTATHFRKEYTLYLKDNNEIESKLGKVSLNVPCYNNTKIIKQRESAGVIKAIPFSVEVKQIPDFYSVYIRHTGPYKEDVQLLEGLFNKLELWVKENVPRHLHKDVKRITLCHDNPSLTDEGKLRISVCMTVPKTIKGEGEVGSLTFSGGKYAIGHFRLASDEYGSAWATMYSKWLPQSGYQPDDGLGFELYLDQELGQSGTISHKQLVDIYIPIKPL